MMDTTSGSIMLAALATIVSTTVYAQSKSENNRVTALRQAPAFAVKDVNGDTVRLSDYKGKKILLSFYRNVGCPVCNVRFHELQQHAGYFKEKGMIVLAVYESSAENMKEYLEGEDFYATMIPNPDQTLYGLYEVDASMEKMMKGMFHGAMGKMKKGKRLFKNKIKQDGSMSRIGADFLIDQGGNIITAYHGQYLGDHLPLSDIKDFLK